jgi:hypothetical protein
LIQFTSEQFADDIAEVHLYLLKSAFLFFVLLFLTWEIQEFLSNVTHCSVLLWQLIRNRYPSKEIILFDDVLGIYALSHVSLNHAWVNKNITLSTLCVLTSLCIYLYIQQHLSFIIQSMGMQLYFQLFRVLSMVH